jgi:hypothetical protein
VVAAAAVVVAVAAAGVAFGLRDRDAPSTVAGGSADYLVAGWLPDGMSAHSATPLGGLSADAAAPVGGEVAAYGDGAAADPWAGPVISVAVSDDPRDVRGGEAVTIGDRDARLEEGADGLIVKWDIEGGRLVVRGNAQVDRATLLAAAEAADDSPAISAAGLPAAFVEIGRGPLDGMMGPAGAGYVGDAEGLLLSYGPDPFQQGEVHVMVFQRPGSESAVDLARLTTPGARSHEVRGHHAVVGGSEGTELFVQWREPSGLVTTVAGNGVDEATLLRIAEGLRHAEPGEIESLIDALSAFDEEISGSAGPSDSGMVVAEGEHEGQSWHLMLAGLGEGRTLELWHRGSSGGVGWDEPTPPLVTGMSSGGTWTEPVVYGLVADGLHVAIELPGGATITPDLAQAPGLLGSGFVAFLPELPDGTEFAVVARDAAGAEVAREPKLYAPVP